MDNFSSPDSIQLKRIDQLLIGGSLLSSIFFFYLLSKPKEAVQSTDIDSIATLSIDSEGIKRKFNGTLSWGEVGSGAKIYQGDEIFTGDKSSATVSFLKTKTKISVPPKSLIKIEEKENELVLEIKEGIANISLKSNENVKIKNGDKIVSLTAGGNSDVSLTNVRGELAIVSTKGSASLNLDGKSITLKENESMKVDQNLKISKLIVLSPTVGQIYNWQDDDVALKLSQPVNGKVQISDSQSFGKIIAEQKLEKATTAVFPDLSSGSYFMKVTNENGDNDIRPFTVRNSFPFVIESPADGDKLTVPAQNNNVTLTWARADKSPSEIEVTYQQDGIVKKNVFRVEDGVNTLTVPGVEGKELEWRGRRLYKTKVFAYSQPAKIALNYRRPFVVTKDLPSMAISKEVHTLQWNKASPNEKFNVTIVDSLKKEKNLTIASNFLSFDKKAMGDFKVTVTSVNFPSEEATSALVRNIKLYYPVLVWDEKSLIPRYSEVESYVAIPLPILESNVPNQRYALTSRIPKVPNEKIPFRVRGNIFEMNRFGSYCLKALGDRLKFQLDSANYCFEFVARPPFDLLPKGADQILEYAKHKGFDAYKLKVPTVEKAVKYQYFVYEDPMGMKLKYTEESTRPEMIWISNRAGTYFFRYKVFDQKNRSSGFSPMSRLIFPISPMSTWQ